MRLRSVFAAGGFARQLRNADSALREAAVAAAADALQSELQRSSGAGVSIVASGARRLVGSANAGDANREFGTLTQSPSPWLAPVLPLALEPMRAAANARVREVFAAQAGKDKAAARTFSAPGKRKKR